jgi:hypothetical protein
VRLHSLQTQQHRNCPCSLEDGDPDDPYEDRGLPKARMIGGHIEKPARLRHLALIEAADICSMHHRSCRPMRTVARQHVTQEHG